MPKMFRAIGFLAISSGLAYAILAVLAVYHQHTLGGLLHKAETAAIFVSDALPDQVALLMKFFIGPVPFLTVGTVLAARFLVSLYPALRWRDASIVTRAVGVYFISVILGYVLLLVGIIFFPKWLNALMDWFARWPYNMRSRREISETTYLWTKVLLKEAGPVVLLAAITARLLLAVVLKALGRRDDEE